MTELSSMQPETLGVELRKLLSPGSNVRINESLARRTTLRVGGPADVFVEPASEHDLQQLLEYSRSHDIPWMVLGRGSNLLVRDGGIRGIVISLGHPVFSKIELKGVRLHCGAGARLRAVAYEAKKAGLSGLEFLEGIPGSIGGALRMNAGAMGSAIFNHVENLRYLTSSGDLVDLQASQVPVEYRNCPLLKENIAISATLLGQPAPQELIDQRMAECSSKRWGSQPAAPSAGCIFKNSLTIPSGKLVQELGLKGKRIGGAVISDVHGNFIVNDANATARDVLALIELVKQKAFELRGIELHTEVQIVGED
jgi:UDP-N-acetylenolpyruvoylglucosamine reductase